MDFLKGITPQKIAEFEKKFEDIGYYFPDDSATSDYPVLDDVWAAYNFYNFPTNKGLSILLLTGEPGVGKTFLGESFAQVIDADFLEYQCVASTSEEQLHSTIDTASVIKRDADNCIAPGILIKALQNAHGDKKRGIVGRKTVLLLDEIDKANAEIDPYFLSFAQSGYIWTPEFGRVAVDEESRKNLFVVVCKNNWRELDGSFDRRVRYTKIPHMTPERMTAILKRASEEVKFDDGMEDIAVNLYREILKNDQLSRKVTAQEIIQALSDDLLFKQSGRSNNQRLKHILHRFAHLDDDKEILYKIFHDAFSVEIQRNEPVKIEEVNYNCVNGVVAENIEEKIMELIKLKNNNIYTDDEICFLIAYIKTDKNRLKLLEMFLHNNKICDYIVPYIESEENKIAALKLLIDRSNNGVVYDSPFIKAINLIKDFSKLDVAIVEKIDFKKIPSRKDLIDNLAIRECLDDNKLIALVNLGLRDEFIIYRNLLNAKHDETYKYCSKYITNQEYLISLYEVVRGNYEQNSVEKRKYIVEHLTDKDYLLGILFKDDSPIVKEIASNSLGEDNASEILLSYCLCNTISRDATIKKCKELLAIIKDEKIIYEVFKLVESKVGSGLLEIFIDYVDNNETIREALKNSYALETRDKLTLALKLKDLDMLNGLLLNLDAREIKYIKDLGEIIEFSNSQDFFENLIISADCIYSDGIKMVLPFLRWEQIKRMATLYYNKNFDISKCSFAWILKNATNEQKLELLFDCNIVDMQVQLLHLIDKNDLENVAKSHPTTIIRSEAILIIDDIEKIKQFENDESSIIRKSAMYRLLQLGAKNGVN